MNKTYIQYIGNVLFSDITPQQIATVMINEIHDLASIPLPPGYVRDYAALRTEGKISKQQGAALIDAVIKSGNPPSVMMHELNMESIGDDDAIRPIVAQVITDNQDVVARIKAGNDKPIGHLVGQVMKILKGRGAPDVVNRLIREAIV